MFSVYAVIAVYTVVCTLYAVHCVCCTRCVLYTGDRPEQGLRVAGCAEAADLRHHKCAGGDQPDREEVKE